MARGLLLISPINEGAVTRSADDSCVRTFAAIYEQYFEFVWRSLRRLGLPQHMVDDATHDVFIVVYNRLDRFDERSSLKTWLFGIAHNVFRDVRRTQYRGEDPGLDPEEIIHPGTGPESAQENRERVSLLYRLLSKMSEDKRAVFILAELEEMTVPEIAQALDVKLNTIYSRLRVAKQEFDEALSRHEALERRGGR